MSADEINTALEANQQALLRKEAWEATRGAHGVMRYIPEDAQFDVVEGVGGARLLRLRDPHKAIVALPDGDPYGVAGAAA